MQPLQQQLKRAILADPQLLAQVEAPPKTQESARAAPELAQVLKEVECGPRWPAPLAEEAYHGTAGRYVRAIADFSEADPAGILGSVLVLFGNAAGRDPFVQVGPERHHANTNLMLVGESGSGGRKGTANAAARHPFDCSEKFSAWTSNCIQSGLSSGEGLIWAVRDPITRKDPIKEKGHVVGYEEVIADHGIEDKRAAFIESEFSNVLKAAERECNTLSGVVRLAFDSGRLRLKTKNNPAQATGAHVSIIGHITPHELLRYMSTTEMGNGLANRFVWFVVRRSKSLPEGEAIPAGILHPFIRDFESALAFAQKSREIRRDAETEQAWKEAYDVLTAGRPGLLGSILSRAEVQVLRLSLTYALLDCSDRIRLEHLGAALAVWEYAEASVRHVFGDAVGDPDADAILTALRQSTDGLDRTAIRDLFSRNRTASAVDRALKTLEKQNLARMVEREKTGGRPPEVWVATSLSSRANTL